MKPSKEELERSLSAAMYAFSSFDNATKNIDSDLRRWQVPEPELREEKELFSSVKEFEAFARTILDNFKNGRVPTPGELLDVLMALVMADVELNHLAAVSLNPKDHDRNELQKEVSRARLDEDGVSVKKGITSMYEMLRGRLAAQDSLMNQCAQILKSGSNQNH